MHLLTVSHKKPKYVILLQEVVDNVLKCIFTMTTIMQSFNNHNKLKIIVGLGNPGNEYAGTRHNAGFMVVDEVREHFGFAAWKAGFKGLVSKGKVAGLDVVLLKPQTFMNLSGASVQAAAAFYKVAPKDVLVVHDELDIPLAEMKFKVGGGDAGHNGLKSITAALGTAEYARLRFGIGRPVHKAQVSDYVLHKFDADEELIVDERVKALAANMDKLLADPHGALAKLKVAG